MANDTELEVAHETEQELILAEAAPVIVPEYDYAGIPDEVATAQRARVDRIFGLARRGLELQAEIGRELLAAQAELEHGRFLPWIDGALGMSQSAAYRAMNVARHVRPEDLPLLRALPADVVQKLVAKGTAETVRTSVVDRLRRREPVLGGEVLEEIRTAAEAAKVKAAEEKKAARVAGLSPEERVEEARKVKARGRSAESRERKDAERNRAIERERQEQEEAAVAGARILMDALGVDGAARFAQQFWPRASDVMIALGDLTGLARVEGQPVVKIPVGHIDRAWRLASYRLGPDDLERAKQIAADIGFDGTAPVATLSHDTRLTNRYKLLSDPIVHLALTDVLKRDEIEARIVPPLPALATEGGVRPKGKASKTPDAEPPLAASA